LLATKPRSRRMPTKRAVYLEEAHVDRAAFWVVIHRVSRVEERGTKAVWVWFREESLGASAIAI
jgi:hypothetical protein